MDAEIEELIEELAITYLLHLPAEEYENEVQLCYAFQLAHWEYLDAPETENLANKLSFNQFVAAMLEHVPGIGLKKQDVPSIVRMFNKMNWQIPVFGAILINQPMDKVLLAQTFVSNAKGGVWMFPRGKVDKKDHGNSFECACREVLEETGYDMRDKAHNDEEHYLEKRIQAGNETKVVGLFLVPGVDEQYPFCPQTQGEVYQFAWFRIQDLWNQMKQTATIQVGGSAAKFLQVFPFLTSLTSFISRQKKKGRAAASATAAGGKGEGVVARTGAAAGGPSVAGASRARGQERRELGLEPYEQEFDPKLEWEPSGSGRYGFDEMVQQNVQLQRGDAMRPYDGIIPQQQQQLMQRKVLVQSAQQAAQKRGKAAAEKQQQQQHGAAHRMQQNLLFPGRILTQSGFAELQVGAAAAGGAEGDLREAFLEGEGSCDTLTARHLGSRQSVNVKRGRTRNRNRGKSAAAAEQPPPPRKAAMTPAAKSFRWQPVQLQLPSISWQGMPQHEHVALPTSGVEQETVGRTVASPSTGGAGGQGGTSSLSGLLGSSEAWSKFALDIDALNVVVDRCLVPLEQGCKG